MDLFGIRNLPFLSRRNFVNELRHILLWSIPAGLIEGQFAAIVVARTFQGSKLLITIATASVPAAYLFSLVWGMLCVGRPKIRLMTLFIGATALLLGSVADVVGLKTAFGVAAILLVLTAIFAFSANHLTRQRA